MLKVIQLLNNKVKIQISMIPNPDVFYSLCCFSQEKKDNNSNSWGEDEKG